MRDATLQSMLALTEEAGPPPDRVTTARSTLQRHWNSIQRMGDPFRVLVDRLGTAINHNVPSAQDAQAVEDMVAEIEGSSSALQASVANLKKAVADYKKAVGNQ